MIQIIRKRISNHFSLLILVLGAVSFFLTNIMIKEGLNRKEYGEYSLLMTYLSMMYIYGLLGIEQVFVRYSYSKKKGSIHTGKFQMQLIFGAIVLTTLLGSITFLLLYGDAIIHPALLIITTISMICLLFYFSSFRINSNFVLAQAIPNFYKLLLLIFTGVFFYNGNIRLDYTVYIISGGVALTLIGALLYSKKAIKFVYDSPNSNKEILTSAFYFAIATTSFSLINFADRLIIENKFGIEKLGDYFYLCNIFLAPFSILQNYVGFRQLVAYKKHFNVDVFSRNKKKVLIYGLLLSTVLLVAVKVVSALNIVNFNFSDYKILTVLLLAFGVIRLYNSAVNAAFDIRIDIYNLKRANIIILSSSTVVIALTIIFVINIESIVCGIITVWIIRMMVLELFLLNQEKKNKN